MNKIELINAIAERTELTKKDTEATLKAFIDAVTEGLTAGDRINLVGFGSFESRERSERNGRNPQTGEAMVIPAFNAVKFKASKNLKEAINA